MEALYADVYGNPLKSNQWDRHHVHDRSTAKGKGCEVKRFINMRGLLLPIVKVEHVRINQGVPKPPLPDKDLRQSIRGYASDLPPMSVYDTFLAISEYMHTLAEHGSYADQRKLAGRIAENYELQTPLIMAGQVTVTRTP
jgi:hypothetical protein